jgi:signal transduction histidine kinase
LDELLETPDRSKHPPRPAGALKSHTAESVVRAADGRLRDVLLTTSQIEGEDDRGDVWLVLARDVTERKQLERQLFHSEKLASIGILAAGVAHEVGNPLSAVSGYTQILQNDDAVPDHAKEHLAAIESQTARIQRIIQDLLDYSRPSAGVRSGVNLPAALPEILSILAAQKLFKKISVAYDFEADLPEVIVDRDHLTQMVVNVALNAAQAMDGVGRLTVGARKRGAGVDVFVSDTGPGVPEKVADRVFDPFFTTKTSGRGTGLGLAICQRIAESNGGGIHLEPGSQPGATFVIHLPLAPSEEN